MNVEMKKCEEKILTIAFQDILIRPMHLRQKRQFRESAMSIRV